MKSQKDRKLGKKRPTGVVVVAILEVLGGISSLAAGGLILAIPWGAAPGAAPGRVASGFGILGGFFAVFNPTAICLHRKYVTTCLIQSSLTVVIFFLDRHARA